MALTVVVFVLTLVALALFARGFVAISWEDRMRPPGCYFSWGVVAALIISVLADSPYWVTVVNFVILLFTAWLWWLDIKERV